MGTFLCFLFLLFTPLSHSQPDRFIRPLQGFRRQEYLESKGEQYDRIAALWLGGVELFRTSTAEPTTSGIFWNVRKDITRYSSLLSRSDLDLTMMLENIVNHEFTGVYHVTINLWYYNKVDVRVPVNPCPQNLKLNPRSSSRSRFLMRETESQVTAFSDLNESPADMIIPICDYGKRGFWFRVEEEKDLRTRRIRIPRNTQRAVLELYVSFHGNDEFWYSNPPNSYITTNGLDTGRGNGAYREVYVTIDGEVVGWEVPFPVIFTGGINPLFWEPIVAIGAFNLPSYDMDLTPFLGKLLDGKDHVFGIRVIRGISFWLVNANLHLWLDRGSKIVHASRVFRHSPETNIERQEEFVGLDGEFEVEAEKETQVIGWVMSSSGNATTVISQSFSFRNFIKFQHNGTYKMVKQKFKSKKKVRVTNAKGEAISRLKVKRKYPLRVITETQPLNERYRLNSNVSHALEEKYDGGCLLKSVKNVQDSKGWMEVKGHSVVSGQASTKQNYTYVDKFNCYSRNVAAAKGGIIYDNSTFVCENSL
ncbi:Peptide-N4 [Sesbania bispinosa]|nr:Peptide-N4 [Sesbania bispinosa]